MAVDSDKFYLPNGNFDAFNAFACAFLRMIDGSSFS